jgi:type I restriction enzyme S subunit
MNAAQLLTHFDRISEAPDAIVRLRRFILNLAVRGKLVEQDVTDEAASELLKRIAVERERFVKAGKIGKEKNLSPVGSEEVSFRAPAGWKWVRIRQVTADRGQTRPDKDFTYIDVTSIDKDVGCIVGAKVIPASEAPSRARKLVAKGDVLYSCVRPYLLNIAIVETDLVPSPIASTAFAVLDGLGLVLSKFLWIALRSPFVIAWVESKMRGQAYPAINDSDFALLPLPLPPFAEQHRIVAKVDELMTLCDRLEAAQAERERRRDRLTAASLNRVNDPTDADAFTFRESARFHLRYLPQFTARPDQIPQLRQSILNLAVRGQLVSQNSNDEPASELLRRIEAEKSRQLKTGELKKQPPIAEANGIDAPFEIPTLWRWVRMDDCFAVGGGIQKTPSRTPKDNPYLYIGVANVYRGRLDLSHVKHFELIEGDLERFRLVQGDILVVEGNGSANEIGRCAIWSGEIKDCVHQNHIIRCRPFILALTPYVLRYLNSPNGIEVMKALAVTSSGLYTLSVGKIRTVMIPLPPLAEQHRIVAKLDELLALCDQLEAQLTTTQIESRQLLESVLHEALSVS